MSDLTNAPFYSLQSTSNFSLESDRLKPTATGKYRPMASQLDVRSAVNKYRPKLITTMPSAHRQRAVE